MEWENVNTFCIFHVLFFLNNTMRNGFTRKRKHIVELIVKTQKFVLACLILFPNTRPKFLTCNAQHNRKHFEAKRNNVSRRW